MEKIRIIWIVLDLFLGTGILFWWVWMVRKQEIGECWLDRKWGVLR